MKHEDENWNERHHNARQDTRRAPATNNTKGQRQIFLTKHTYTLSPCKNGNKETGITRLFQKQY